MAMMCGGGFYAFRTYKDNRPTPMWVALPINPELPTERQDEIVRELKVKLCAPEILVSVSKDLGLMKEWKMASDAQCADEIRKRILVRVGETSNSIGTRVPSIDIGMHGISKERDLSGKIAVRLMRDVWKILGVKPPPQK
jgi:hypothetical protein